MMEPQECVGFEKRERKCCCLEIVVFILAILFSFTIGLLIGAALSIIILLSLPAIIVLAIVLGILLLITLILFFCNKCHNNRNCY